MGAPASSRHKLVTLSCTDARIRSVDPVAPAVAAAIRDATGAVIRDLPLTPERVWRALLDRSQPEKTARRYKR